MFLAIGLSMVVIVVYYAFFAPPPPKPQPPAETSVSASSTAPAASAMPSAEGTTAPAPQPTMTAVQAAQVLTVETPLYTARIDRRGGRLISFKLKEYRQGKSQTDWGDLIPPLRALLPSNAVDEVSLVEMVGRDLPQADPFRVEFMDNPPLTQQFDGVLFEANREGVALATEVDQPATLVLTGTGPDGLTLRKELIFHPDSYVVGYTLQVINYGDAPRNLRVRAVFGEGPQRADSQFRSHQGPIYEEDGSVDTETADDIEGQLLLPQFDWLGITDNYFLSAAKALSPVSHGAYRAEQVPPGGEDAPWAAIYGIELPAVALQPNKLVSGEFMVYLGPKQVADMRRFDAELENSLDLTLDILATPLLVMLRWFHSYVGNYGVAIILLTIVVRVGLFPLTYKGMVAMKRMQKLQPKMVSLREKFKNDREKLNKEMMGMYKRYKVNPLGGCLPIALQIPIFFALYSALLGAIELRHSPFALWIQDLSAHDPLYITPVLMGGSMWLQQKLTPTTLDPTQAKIMMWMPVVFTAFMFNFPAGLVLYWLTSNTLSIAQQLLINRINVPEPEEQEA